MRIFTVMLMILVGAVFVMGPVKIIDNLTAGFLPLWVWIAIVFTYYVLASILPIDKLIGKIYPVFGFTLLFMAVGILVMLFVNALPIPELTFSSIRNMHHNSDSYPVFPMMFVTIACGAVSGFHSTQSPLMARCLQNERLGRRVFYGAMVAEGVVALIWAAAGMAFWGGVQQLNQVMIEHNENAAWAVHEIAVALLGSFGAVLALIGVVAAPITSADTAFRSARLIIADFMKISQKPLKNRIIISLPIFLAGFIISQSSFGIIWRYMAWSNQTLAMIVLWTISVYLLKEKKQFIIALIPAVFMTMVCITYILMAPEGFRMSGYLPPVIAGFVCIIFIFYFFLYHRKYSLNNKY